MTSRPTSSNAASGGENRRETLAPFRVDWDHHLVFTRDALEAGNPILRDAIRGEDANAADRGLIAVIDDGVTRTNPGFSDRLRSHLEGNDLPELREVLEIEGGEACKNHDDAVESVLRSIDVNHICRKSTVLVIGGGAVLDAAGYAAATAHRGVRLVRMPSTVLSQCDSGVGVKNGINRFDKKNFIGTFAPPNAVVCDYDLLRSLSDRDWTSGLSEIVKIAMLKDPALFETIERDAERIRNREDQPSHEIIARSAELHLRHITDGGDPFELQEARPLDFGHWSAHKLEQMTGFELPHGEAVSIGIALDMVYSELTGIADPELSRRTLEVLEAINLPTSCPALERRDELIAGIEEFREHLGGRLTISLVRELGEQVDIHDVDAAMLEKAITILLDRSAS